MAAVDERCEDGQNQQTDFRILHQSEGQQRLQEGGGQRRQQVVALVTLRNLRSGEIPSECGGSGEQLEVNKGFSPGGET